MKRSWTVWLAVILLAGCNLPSGGDAAPPAAGADLVATRQALAPLAETLLVRINHDRDVLDLPAYTPSQALDDIAGLRAEDMLMRGYVGSTGPGDASVAAQELMGAAGYRGRLGEMVYEFIGEPASLVDATVTTWLSSEAHRALLLDPAYAYVGAGVIGDGERWIIALELAEQGP